MGAGGMGGGGGACSILHRDCLCSINSVIRL